MSSRAPLVKRIFLFVVLFCIILVCGACRTHEMAAEDNVAPLEISLATVVTTYSGLAAIAEEKGFFKQEKLNVSMPQYPSGLAALQALVRGEADLAMGADIAFVTLISKDPSLRILSSLSTSSSNEIVARKDRGIHKPADLRGKRIGFHRDTTADYYLDAFLLVNAIPSSEVETVHIPPQKIAASLTAGEVDAISTWGVYVHEAKKALGDNAQSWQSQNTQEYHWLLVCKQSRLQSIEAVERLLKALKRAEDYVLHHEGEAQEILVRRWNLDPDFVREFWSRTRLRVTLGQSLLVTLDSFARWKGNKSGEPGKIPNFFDFIDTKALDAIDPQAVTILR